MPEPPIHLSSTAATSGETEYYRKQGQFVDALVGRFVSVLKAEVSYYESIFVVTTDHGQTYLGCLCSIPLIIHAPGVSPKIADVGYSHLDFVPKLRDLLGMPLGPEESLPGKSAFTPGPAGLQGRD